MCIGKLKISTTKHIEAKIQKQFLPMEYAMLLYEWLPSFKQKGMSVIEYTFMFNNLSILVGLNKRNEEMTSYHLVVLNLSIRNEIEVVHWFNLEDVQICLNGRKEGMMLWCKKTYIPSALMVCRIGI